MGGGLNRDIYERETIMNDENMSKVQAYESSGTNGTINGTNVGMARKNYKNKNYKLLC